MKRNRKFQVPERVLHVEERAPNQSGKFTVEESNGAEWCRHRVRGAAERCCRNACSQRYATEYRTANVKEGEFGILLPNNQGEAK